MFFACLIQRNAIALASSLLLCAVASAQDAPRLYKDVSPLRGTGAPKYPTEARRAAVCGIVHFLATVSPDGKAQDVEIVLAYPPRIFEESVNSALQIVSFPKTAPDGRPAPYRIASSYRFILDIERECPNGPLPVHPVSP